jgi:hypothetical protein
MSIQEVIKQLAELIENGQEQVLIVSDGKEYEIKLIDKYSDGNIKLTIK